jgi:hypothetical protein
MSIVIGIALLRMCQEIGESGVQYTLLAWCVAYQKWPIGDRQGGVLRVNGSEMVNATVMAV